MDEQMQASVAGAGWCHGGSRKCGSTSSFNCGTSGLESLWKAKSWCLSMDGGGCGLGKDGNIDRVQRKALKGGSGRWTGE